MPCDRLKFRNFTKKKNQKKSKGFWVEILLDKNGPSKICDRQPLKNFAWFIFEDLDPNMMDTPLNI